MLRLNTVALACPKHCARYMVTQVTMRVTAPRTAELQAPELLATDHPPSAIDQPSPTPKCSAVPAGTTTTTELTGDT